MKTTILVEKETAERVMSVGKQLGHNSVSRTAEFLLRNSCSFIDSKGVDPFIKMSNEVCTKVPTIDNKVKKDKKVKKTFSENSDEFRLANFLLNHIRKNKPDFKEPNLQSWAKVADAILRLDKRPLETAKKLIEWVQNDSFEQSNVLSMTKFRKRFDSLEMKMKNSFEPKVKPKFKNNGKSSKTFAEIAAEKTDWGWPELFPDENDESKISD